MATRAFALTCLAALWLAGAATAAGESPWIEAVRVPQLAQGGKRREVEQKLEEERRKKAEEARKRREAAEQRRKAEDARKRKEAALRKKAEEERKRRAAEEERRAETAGKLPKGATQVDHYRYAKSFLRRGQYREAEAALKAFVAAYPDGPLTANAIYWLGETYFVRGDFALAAVQFVTGYEKFPDHPKGPDNLLKLGMSLAKLDKKRDACATLLHLRRKYPKASGRIKRTAAAERGKLNCR